MKKYVLISGFCTNQPNRGNAALSYGAISFLLQEGYLHDGQEIVRYRFFINPFKKRNSVIEKESIVINGKRWIHKEIPVFFVEKWFTEKTGIFLPFTNLGRTIKQVAFEAADYGGDGFSDIYGDKSFRGRMKHTFLLWKANIPLIMLPQTIGPFYKKENFELAVKIMKYADRIYVRDDRFIEDFTKLGLKYCLTKDISYYMQPEPWDIEIKSNPIGLNVSGLAYCNNFRGLEKQFDSYPDLVDKIINHFRDKGCTVYLIPHSYSFNKPDDNDDMVACRQAYNRLNDKSNVELIDKDLTAPQIKYLISKMTFFIGARMHANFAAIYTGVPVFGTAYSYKFAGAFNSNGLDSDLQTEMINYLSASDIPKYVNKIDRFYHISRNIKL